MWSTVNRPTMGPLGITTAIAPAHRKFVEQEIAKKYGTSAVGIRKVAITGDPAETRTAALVVGDAISFLASYQWHGDEFIYCDPPYMHETRTSNQRYLFEMENRDHVALLDVLLQIPAKVMLSGYHSKLYEKKLCTWRALTYTGTTRRGPRTEWLWCNFPEPVELHDYRYLGRDFRERQDIKRLKERWVARLAKMPLLKRRALLAALKESNDRTPRQD